MKALKIFCNVVDRRSFSRAANDNGISQSSVSQVVHQLEERLGVRLLDRSKRPFVLTAEGQRFYDGCRQLVKRYFDLEEEVRTLHDETARRLVIASIYSVGLAPMSASLRDFSAKHPLAKVRLEYLHPSRVYEAVEHGEVDLGLVSYPEESRTLTAIPWRDEPLVVVCHPRHRLTRYRSLSIKELAGEKLVAFETGLRIRSEIDRVLVLDKVKIDVTMEFDNIETMKRAIEINEGVSILPEPTVAREIALGSLAKIALKDQHLKRPLGIIHRRDRKLSSIARQFVELLQGDSELETQPSAQPPTANKATPVSVA